jgi:hypothetical protein
MLLRIFKIGLPHFYDSQPVPDMDPLEAKLFAFFYSDPNGSGSESESVESCGSAEVKF